MTNAAVTDRHEASRDGDLSLPNFSPKAFCGALAVLASVVAGACLLDAYDSAAPDIGPAPLAAAQPAVAPPTALPGTYTALFDPASLGVPPVALALNVPLGSSLEPTPAPPIPTPVMALAEPEDVQPGPGPALPRLDEAVPLPTPRPFASRAPIGRGPLRTSGRQMARQDAASSPAATADNRSFFEKLFGLQSPPPGAVLAYGEPDDGVLGRLQSAVSSPMVPSDRQTAVYDIAAHTVYMPDGSRLEAHSGLGERLDDPRHVHERNRGATPPHIYDLTMREQLFHGVQALRLNPVGGGNVFGRTGLLAHTYMLGPNGDSNGCVSFKNYNEFLQAFARGEVKRLAVVARRG